ncbi:MAG TPA: LuxR C-terminal-related transcriptional regulator [Chloroflexaceae bacterium]|nr:LuxR C-terminal-related transcriptional regulator [Chloroflexaceae bacterium]
MTNPVADQGRASGGAAPELLHNVPAPPTPLIGRAQETAEAARRLRRDDVHLLTLVGPPGIGKTRLAIATAVALRAEFTQGVYFVDLSPVGDAGLVLPTIARAVGLRPAGERPPLAELRDFLLPRRALLVLDNFEQVLPAAGALADLLRGAQRFKLLVTSRELLRIAGEHTFPVPPLPLPPVLTDQGAPRTLTSLSPERLGAYDAIRLFVQRAEAVQPTFALTPENALTIAGICCRLDGLPLAIELAAARVRHLPPHAMYERLEQRLQLLTGGARDLPARQRTLRAAVAWSYQLLDEAERRLLRRLAVFRGGCSLSAVEAVCGGSPPLEPLSGVASLVDKSLLQQMVAPHGEARYRMLESIHEFAREQLEAGDEAHPMRRRHASYFAGLADRAEQELRQANQRSWFQLVELELDNLRAALEWALESGDIAAASRMMSGTLLFWIVYGRQHEGIHWSQRLLARIGEVEPEHQVRLLRSAALLVIYQDREAAERLARRAVAVARADGDKRQLGWSLWALSTTMLSGPEAEAVSQEALVLFQEVGDQPGLGLVYNSIGERARLSGDHAGARSAYERSLAIAERTGDARRQYYVLYNLAFVAQREGDHREAMRMIHRSLVLCQSLGVQTDVIQELLALAGSLAALGKPLQAARLLGAAHAFLQRSDALIDPSDQPEHDRNMAFVRAQLGEAAFEAAWAEGQAMTFDQAVAYAQTIFDADDLSAPLPQRDEAAHPASELTRREREVARLVAEGRSNRAIAEALVITERTVEGHVSNILAKLGFRSRAQIAAWVAAGGRPER